MNVTLLSRDIALLAHWRDLTGAVPRLCSEPERLLDELPAQSLVLVDLECPGLPPLSDERWQQWSARLRLIGASSLPQPEQNMLVLTSGFRGYAHAYAPVADWKQIVATVEAGGIWVGVDVMARLLGALQQQARPQPTGSAGWRAQLSAREADVARLAARGQSNKQIARELDITERTVKAHLTAIFAKLGVRDRLQLALLVNGMA